MLTVMRNDRPWVAAQMSNRKSQAEEYAEAHCDTLVDWLKNNTVPCACAEKYTRCEKNGACFGLDENKRLLCRRCYVPLGFNKVSCTRSTHSLSPRAPHRRCALPAPDTARCCGKQPEAHARWRCHISSKHAAAVAVAAWLGSARLG